MKLSEASVLVVDDEPMLRQGFATWLRRGGCQRLWTAANGADAIDIFLEQEIDILVSDVRMPILDGISLLERINESGKPVPSVIFVSGFSTVELPVAYSLGVEAFLAKPFTAHMLIDTVARSLASRDELWATPMMETPATKVVVEAGAKAGHEPPEHPCRLRFGRGGFSCQVEDLLPISPLNFLLTFGDEGRTIEGQGHVRWFSRQSQRVGVEFHYLAPDTRATALAHVAARSSRSFIPL